MITQVGPHSYINHHSGLDAKCGRPVAVNPAGDMQWIIMVSRRLEGDERGCHRPCEQND